ncbi:MAG: glycosyltransferase family 4 protein [bacterium]
MKIALIGPSYPFKGGIAHYTTLLYRHLKTRHQVTFFTFKRQYPEFLYPGKGDKDVSQSALREDGAEQFLDSLNPFTWFRAWRRLRRLQPDLVILPWWVYFWTPHFYYLAQRVKRKLGSRLLFICHNVVEHESNRIAKFCTSLVLKRGDLFLVHSKDDEANLKKMLPAAPITRAFHPSYDVFPQSGVTKASARRQLGLHGKTILFFGFVRPYKGLKYLLEAMPMILQEEKVNLLIVGEFWEGKEECQQQIKALGLEKNVQVIDRYVPNEKVEVFFAASDLLVLPYVSATGSGLVQLAFGMGTPVLVTNVGALPEVVRDEYTGFIVPPQDPTAIAARIIQYYRINMEESFRENIMKDRYRFSWGQLVEKIEALYARSTH